MSRSSATTAIDEGSVPSRSTAVTTATPAATSSELSLPLLVDDSKHYCSICLSNVKAGLHASSRKVLKMSKLTRYSVNMATSAMRLHLRESHNITLGSAKTGTGKLDLLWNITSQKNVDDCSRQWSQHDKSHPVTY